MRLVRVLVGLLALVLIAPISKSQVVGLTDQTTTPSPGAGHDYLKMLNETVNPASGSVSFRLDVQTPPGRKLSLPFAFEYDSNGAWFIQQNAAVPGQPILPYENLGPLALGAWSYTIPRLTDHVLYFYPSSRPPDGSSACQATGSYIFTDLHGGRHDLQLSNVAGMYHADGSLTFSCLEAGWQQFTSGGDGELQATLVSPKQNDAYAAAPIVPAQEPNMVPAERDDGTPTIVDADGIVYTFPVNPGNGWGCAHWRDNNNQYFTSGFPSSIEDRNGNVILISANQSGLNYCYPGSSFILSVTDTLGRTLLSASNFGTSPSTVTVAGLANPYTITWFGGSSTGNGIPISKHTITANGTCAALPNGATGGGGITAIALPNGKNYSFAYDSGYLSKITYPSDGYISYTWGVSPLSGFITYTNSAGVADACQFYYDTPAVTHRYISFDGITIALQQDFSYSTTWSTSNVAAWTTKTTTVTTHDLLRGTSFQTIYTYGPYQQFSPNISVHGGQWISVEKTIAHYDVGGSLLKTVTKNFTGLYTPIIACQFETLDNGLVSGVFYAYANGQQLSDKKEYDYGQLSASSCSGSPIAPQTPTPAREMVTSYQAFPATPIYPGSPSILSKPSSAIVYDKGSRVAETDYAYDQATTFCAGSPNCVTLTSHDATNYSATSTAPRGNTTTVTKQCFQGSTPCTNSTTTYTFDETGQTTSMTDPCGNAACGDMAGANHTTKYIYSDNFDSNPSNSTNAYLTQLTNPLGHSSTFKYAFSDGQLISTTDPNNLVTSYIYGDPLRRLTEVDRPDGGWTKTCYTDAGGSICSQSAAPPYQVVSQQSINSTQAVTSVSVLDGVGHVAQTQLTSDPQGTVYTDTTFDGLGRIWKQSNPYRTGTDATTSSGTTTKYYDALGRPCLVVPPDGILPTGEGCPTTQSSNTIFTSYSGNTTTVTDQTGKSRKSVTDALGRLTQVFEDPTGLNYETDYSYNALNDLLCAGQKGNNTGTFTNCASIPAAWRPRIFTYDSLSRLLTSANPEFGNITYSYDMNNNVASKKDARGITISYGYDVLNRERTTSYSNGDSTISTTYDESNCLGLTSCQNIGHKTSVTDAAGSEIWAYQVDAAMYRSFHKNQRTTSTITKTTTYLLDLAGNTTQITYPTGRMVNYTVDNANRPSSAVDSSNGITYAADWSTGQPTGCTATAVCYTPQGTFYTISIGQTPAFTGLNLTHTYNSRLQPLEFKASSTGGNAIDIAYSFVDPVTSHNAGRVYGITNNLDASRSQQFAYDQLNRIVSAQTTSTHSTSPAHCWGEVYGLDPWGNLQSVAATNNSAYTGCSQESGFSHTADANNHLSGFGYDTSGNTSGDGVNSYTWNAESQLKTAGGVTFIYDGDGRRATKVGSKLYWYGSGGEILAETDSSGSLTAEYIFFGGQRIATLPAGGNPTYYVEDMLGTSRVLTSNTGVVCYDADFYPYGGERPYKDSCPQNFKFEGKERDTETGNDDFGAREYSNRFGRWLSTDWSAVPAPIPYANLTNPQTLNLYAMVADNPESFADLDGHLLNFGRVPETMSEDELCVHANWNCQVFGANSASQAQNQQQQQPAQQQQPGQQQQAQAQSQQKEQQLTFETVSGGSKSATWVIQWKLSNKSEKGGWIVQEITDKDATGTVFKHFWEAWQVPANSQYTIYFPDKKDDTFIGLPSGTRATAEARFYEGLQLPPSFKPNNQATLSGILPSTITKPRLSTSHATAPVVRLWTVP